MHIFLWYLIFLVLRSHYFFLQKYTLNLCIYFNLSWSLLKDSFSFFFYLISKIKTGSKIALNKTFFFLVKCKTCVLVHPLLVSHKMTSLHTKKLFVNRFALYSETQLCTEHLLKYKVCFILFYYRSLFCSVVYGQFLLKPLTTFCIPVFWEKNEL